MNYRNLDEKIIDIYKEEVQKVLISDYKILTSDDYKFVIYYDDILRSYRKLTLYNRLKIKDAVGGDPVVTNYKSDRFDFNKDPEVNANTDLNTIHIIKGWLSRLNVFDSERLVVTERITRVDDLVCIQVQENVQQILDKDISSKFLSHTPRVYTAYVPITLKDVTSSDVNTVFGDLMREL